MIGTLIEEWAKRQVLSALGQLRTGSLTVQMPGETRVFGNGFGHHATLVVESPDFFTQVLAGGEVGVGDAYMDGSWSTPDLVALVSVMLENQSVITSLPAWLSWLPHTIERLSHWRRGNSIDGSRQNIHEHYDLGNTFFRLFLDRNLLYSSAIYARPDDSLEAAQTHKLRVICERLELEPSDRVLEIGTGWGGLALFAATHYGCHVTTTTISTEQFVCAAERLSAAGDVKRRIDLRLEDYRDLRGSFDKIVSVEMFEAVGLDHYDAFFGACDRLLTDGGRMLMQTITVDDWRFDDYLSTPSWIAKRIFPGSELASVARILTSLGRVTRLNLDHADQIGVHYARTLHQWRERFHGRLDEVRALGFDDRFIRMWDLYLGYCEAAFRGRHIGNIQLTLRKAGVRSVAPRQVRQEDAVA